MSVQNEMEIKNKSIPLFQKISTYKNKNKNKRQKTYIDGGMLECHRNQVKDLQIWSNLINNNKKHYWT